MMDLTTHPQPNRAQVSRAAIQRLYTSMKHLLLRGSYKPLGVSGEAMIESLLSLEPEIYGSIADEERVELSGLLYIFQRLPQGIEECRFVKLISREGFEHSDFEPIIPSKRRRNCYRVDQDQYFIEMTRGRSDVYDVLTHLTFMYIESEKIRRNSLDSKNRRRREWLMLEKIVHSIRDGQSFDVNVGLTYLSSILGRTFAETSAGYQGFEAAEKVNSLFEIVYGLGKKSIDEHIDDVDREISFSKELRIRLGHHFYAERWANQIKQVLVDHDWIERPLHIISSNMHSVMNSLFASAALKKDPEVPLSEIASQLSLADNGRLRDKVNYFAQKNGLISVEDISGTNIDIQIIDTLNIDCTKLPSEIQWNKTLVRKKKPILIVMDYAFGEQAFEVMDELLKPFEINDQKHPLDVRSINIMGKAGILCGGKGDIMIPTAHVFEGTADNYPFENQLTPQHFAGSGIEVQHGPMITVMGTSLQNKDILRYFLHSSWSVIGLEMEGAHYQKAIQAASKIRNNTRSDVCLRYAYYASDNPLETGSTLASGSLGLDGVVPTYLITVEILNGIINQQV